MAISKALIKYGYSSFSLEIMEYCDATKVVEREQYYFDLIKPEYNILTKAGSLLGFKHSKETIDKMKARI
jgi:group I intron endonuclease